MPLRGPRNRRIALALLVVVIAVSVFLLTRSSRESEQAAIAPAAEPPGAIHDERRATPVDPSEPREPVRAPELERPVEPAAPSLHGRVVDEHFAQPVFARIESDAGAVAFSDPLSGEFRFPSDTGADGRLTSSADGFLDESVDARAALEAVGVEIRMRAERFATLIVQFSDGSPACDLPVAWRSAVEIPYSTDPDGWIDTRAQDLGDALETRTNLEGIARLALASPAIAVVKEPSRGVTKTVKLVPGREVLVVLPKDVLTLRFVDVATWKPIAGLELDAWCSQEIHALMEPLLTDTEGMVKLAPTSYPVLVRRHGTSHWSSRLECDRIQVSIVAVTDQDQLIASLLRIAAPVAETVTVRVMTSSTLVHLVDAVSGAPIDAEVRIDTLPRKPSPPPPGRQSKPIPWTLASPRANRTVGTIASAHEGALRLPLFLSPIADACSRGIDPNSELALVAAGYQPYVVHGAVDAPPDVDGTPLYKLTPAKSRSLRLSRPDGGPYLGNIVFASLEAKVLCYSSCGEASGLYGPFDWLGGPLAIYSNFMVQEPWMIPAAELEQNEIVSFTVPLPMGTIVVDGIPESAACVALIARSHREVDYSPDAAEPGIRRFTSVPAGSYLVGPREWVRGAALQAMEAQDLAPAGNVDIRVQVRAGESAVVHWREMWSAGKEISGRVRVTGLGRIEPFLVPLYGSEGGESDRDATKVPRMIFGRREPRIELDRDGVYRIGPNEGLPRLIAICLADPTSWGTPAGFHVIESIRPGESAEIVTGSVELTWKGRTDRESISVSYDLPLESLRRPLWTFYMQCKVDWNPPNALRLDGVPLHVDHLVIRNRIQPIAIEAGKLTRVEIDAARLSELEQLRRR